MKRQEAVALLKELSSAGLIQPTFVLIEQKKPDSFELVIKGDFDFQAINKLASVRFAVKNDVEKGFLAIF